MASPQTENGYTKIANEIMEALAKNRLSGQERQIVDVVLRKTYGFHKTENIISMGQFSEFTGINRSKVAKLLKSLLSKRVLRVVQKDNTKGNSYIFQKDYEQWKVLPKRITVPQKDNRVLPKRITKVLPKRVHTKESIKENIKEIHISEVKPFLEHASKTFQDTFKETLFIDWGKDGSIVKGLLKTYDLEKLEGLWNTFLASEDEWIKKAGYSIGIFKTQINKLLTRGQTKGTPKTAGNWAILEKRKREGFYDANQ